MAPETHTHVPVLVLTEGVDLEEQVPVGYACAICGQPIAWLVPREPEPELSAA